ncbi:RNA polymerase-binding protein RbpA [Okibacterium fritillariae]|jgi:ribosomal protein L37AE/L43A|uniref:RNA polymerase-binding protein RbpA n=1 Tax=Okibacterium fritillariae TaxID=123320 RepID=A0A1T5JL06_9MICO|nr:MULTISPECIES: RNA polymerase-binding protein RbpA [Microbacteriaceae]ONI63556.1 electron transporter [Leifsonia sp. ALI-44-B]SKC52089.1 RNA polymerase-binding protein [Okibacterium fritillariae]
MADRSLRGMRLGAQSLQSEEGVIFSERTHHSYLCPVCNKETSLYFAADAEAPETWECRHCSSEAVLMIGSEPIQLTRADPKQARTHWDMLLERRTEAELEELLQERLNFLRARRGQKIA